MSPVEITFVLVGIAFLIISCFVGKGQEKAGEYTIPDEVLEVHKQEISRYAERILEEKSEEVVVKTDDYLSRVSNEKIMAVNDFSAQILEKIDNNHKEVVFLYDMLNQKEDELKQTVQQFEQEKIQMKEAVEEAVRLTKEVTSSSAAVSAQGTGGKQQNKKPDNKKTAPKATVIREDEYKAEESSFVEELPADKQRDEVLRLHKSGKSVLEISKTLGMGQGEVKLIIGLYGA